MPVTMKDIAADLGLSIVTISKALRQHPDVSEATRARILKRVKELHYRPNINAQNLATGRSNLLGLIVPGLLHPFFAEIAKSLAEVIRKHGYSLVIASSEEDISIEEQEIERMVALRLDGLVIASSAKSPEIFRHLEEQGTPYVLVDRRFSELDHNFVGIDDVTAGLLATKHLIEGGRKRVAHIRGGFNSTGDQRLEGYKLALARAGVPFQEKYVVMRRSFDTDSRRQGKEAMDSLLALRPRPDAVFCYNDPMAIGAMEAIEVAGLRIPRDIAVVGCGNLSYDDLLRVAISSIDQQSGLIGERAGKLLLRIIESKKKVPSKTVVLEPALIERASSSTIP